MNVVNSGTRNGWNADLLALSTAAITLIMIGVYVALINQQRGEVAVWFVAGLGIAALLCLYGMVRSVPLRRPALAVSGAIMALLGFAGILTIGFPVLCAGALALIAALRR